MDNVFELFATLGLNTSAYDEGLAQAEGKGSTFGTGLNKAAKVAGAAMVAAGTAVVGFGASSVRAGMDFDSSMSQVAATMGTTVDQITDLRDFAQEMGQTTAFSATEAADALNYMALAGYDADTSMQMLPQVLNLAAAGGMDLATASDMVTDSQTALGLSLSETETLVDQMAKTASTTNTSVAQLGDAILTVGGTAQFMSGGTDELNSVLGIMADNGIKGAEAGTHLRNMILSLSSPTTDAQATLDALGVSIFDAEGNMRSWSEIFPEISTAMDDLTSEERVTALSSIFNTRDVAAATALMSTSVDRWEEVGVAIDGAAGSAQQMADTQLDNLAGDITLFQSALEGAKITLSDSLTPSLRDFVQMGTTGLSEVSAGFQEGGLSGAMEALGSWLSDAIGMIVESMPEMIEAGAQLLGALGQGLIDNAPQILQAITDVIVMLGSYLADANNVNSLIDSIFEITEMLTTTLLSPDVIETFLLAAINILIAVSMALIEHAPDLIGTVLQVVANVIVALAEALPQIASLIVDHFINWKDNINARMKAWFGTTNEEAWAFLVGLVTRAGEGLVNLIDTVRNFGADVIEGIVTWFSNLDDNFLTGLDNIMSTVGNFGADIIESFFNTFEDIKSTVADAIGNLLDLFDFDWELPQIKTPHFNVTGGEAPWGFGGQGSLPSVGIEWYAKAYKQAAILEGATIFGMASGRLLGGGEKGHEIVAGEDRLRQLIREESGNDIRIPIYLGEELIDEIMINSNQRFDYISGGRS